MASRTAAHLAFPFPPEEGQDEGQKASKPFQIPSPLPSLPEAKGVYRTAVKFTKTRP